MTGAAVSIDVTRFTRVTAKRIANSRFPQGLNRRISISGAGSILSGRIAMRPLTNFTLHAVLAAALVAFAATSAAGKEPHYYTIELTNASIARTSGATGKDEKIPITSFMWSTKSTATGRRTYDPVTFRTRVGDASPASGGGTNEMRMDDAAGKERPKASSDMAMKGSKIGENAAIGQAIGDMAAEGNEDRAQATGKRQHKPLLMRGHYDSSSPPQRGTLTVLASGGSCRVGARYPSLQLSGGGKTHVLQGVTVTSCGGASAAAGDGLLTEEISFSYQTIKFQY